MVTTIGQSGTTVTFDGAHKSGTLSGGNTTTVLQIGSGGAADDVDRYVIWKNGGTGSTVQWEFRRIIAQTASTLTVHDPFTSTPSSGDNWVMSIGLSDIPVGNTLHTQIGDRSHFINGDFQLENDCYLAMAKENLECDLAADISVLQSDNGTAWSMGTLWGGEANGSTETTDGCGLTLTTSATGLINMFGVGAGSVPGATITCWYGSAITLLSENAGGRGFSRFDGTNRMIGCSVDGDIGGRFIGPATEWVDCRMTGNVTLQVAWSLGAEFTRPITNVLFAQGIAAAKSFQAFAGDFRDCTFADSMTNVFRVEGSVGSVIQFIDCTTFDDGDISDSGNGILRQLKSINYVVTDAAGVAIDTVKVLVTDTSGTTQSGGVQTGDVSGVIPEVQAEFFTWTNASPSVDHTPFTIRIRKYNFEFQQFTSLIDEPVRQEFRLSTNAATALSEAAAAALTGIAIDFGAETVTVTAAHSLNDIYDYCQSQVVLDANMDEDEFLKSANGTALVFNDNWTLVMGSGGDLSETVGSLKFGGTGSLTINSGAIDGGLDGLDIDGDMVVNVAADTTLNFSDVTVSGDTTNAAAGNTLVINSTNGSVLTTSEPGTGNGLVDIRILVPVTVTAVDTSGAPVAGARVYLETSGGASGSITTVASTQNQVAGGVSITLTVPAGVIDGDVLYAVLGNAEAEDGTWTVVPAGWTEVVSEHLAANGGVAPSQPGVNVYRRIAASEPASYIWTSDFSSGLVGIMTAHRGSDQTTPEDTAPQVDDGTGAVGDPDPPSITTITDGSVVLAIGFGDGSQTVTAPPSGYASLQNVSESVGGNGMTLSVAELIIATAASEDPGTFNFSGADEWGAITLAIRPAAGSGVTEIINALTDASGIASTTAQITVDTVVSGRVRRGTTAPRFQQAQLSGTITTAAGLSITTTLVSDE